jgi:toxin ParE1/3/4
VKLRYTLRAAAELDEVLTYIGERSPQAAHRVHTRIQVIIDLLLRHPHAGQLTSKGRLRRMVASPYPYLIFIRRPRTKLSFMACAIALAGRHPCLSDAG